MKASSTAKGASKGRFPARARAALVAAAFAALALAIHPGAGNALAGGSLSPKNVSPEEAYKLIERNADNPDFVILDVRTDSEFRDGHIPRAVNVDFNSGVFREEVDKLDKGKTYLVYCRSGNRSGRAVQLMGELGFGQTYNVTSGFVEWQKKGFPTEM